MKGFIKYNRSDEAKNLESRPNENHLLNVIARRISRNGNRVLGVKQGEALIGDYDKIGLKRQPYRTALSNLIKWGYVTTRVTNRTTYASLSNTSVYDCNIEEPNQPSNQTVTTKPTNDQPIEQPTSNHNQEVKNKERKKEELKNKYIPIYKELVAFFMKSTGKTIRLKSTDELISKQGNYKLISARLNEGTSIEDMKGIITLKKKHALDKNHPFDIQYVRFETLFAPLNIQKYLNELDNSSESIITEETKFPYQIPNFATTDERYMYFLARYNEYKQSGLLDEYKANTEYRKRAIYQKDAERLCFELELEQPELLKIEFNYKV